MTRIEAAGNSKVRFTVTPFLDSSMMVADKALKSTILKELQQRGEQIDIKPLMREYVECIGRIHEKVRGALGTDVQEWERILNTGIMLFRSRFGLDTSILGLAAIATGENGAIIESTPLFTDFIERRRQLESKNRMLDGLTARFASNEIVDN